MYKCNLFTLVIIFLSVCSLHAQQNISGILIDSKTKQPVEFASISKKINSASGTMSDDKGRFTLKVDKNKDSLYIMHMQYEMKIIAVKDIKEEILLNPLKTNLDTVNVYGLGPKSILVKAFDNVKKNYHLDDFFVDIDMYAMTKEAGTVTMLGYNRSLWRPFGILGIRVFIPIDFIRTVGQTDTITDNLTFGIDDMIWYYNVEIFFAKLMKKQIAESDDKFTMQIIEDDGKEIGYIVCREEKPQDTKSVGNKTVKIESSLTVPRKVKYYIDASDFSIQKIETDILANQQNIINRKDGDVSINKWVSTINFSRYRNKLYLSNCFSRVEYYYTDDVDGVIEEKVMFDARACYELGDKYDKPNRSYIHKSLEELMIVPTFKFFIEKE